MGVKFEEGSEPTFSEHSLLTDNSTLTSSFALESTVKTHNDSHRGGIMRRGVSRVDSEDHDLGYPPKFSSGPPYSEGEEVLCEANGFVL